LGVATDDSLPGLWSMAASSSTDEVDRRLRRGGLSFCLIMVVVLGFLFCEDGDFLEVDLFTSGQSGEFRKAPPANVTMHFMSGVCWISWYLIMCTHAFIPTVWFWKERHEALYR
jgi:hypothetical protein